MLSKFQNFVEERKYIYNVSTATLRWYESAWQAWGKWLEEPVTEEGVRRVVVKLRQTGITASSVNSYCRVLNAFLKWMKTGCKIPKQIEEEFVPVVFTREQISRLVRARPNSYAARRAHLIAKTILDVGARADEVLGLRPADLNLHDLLLTLNGKGRKQRVVPMSRELRKDLYRWLQQGHSEWLFDTRTGTRLSYRNALRDFVALAGSVGIVGRRVSFHSLRHTFATHFIRQGGDVFRLQRMLGHTTLAMSQKYVHLQTADLSASHERLSLLNGAVSPRGYTPGGFP